MTLIVRGLVSTLSLSRHPFPLRGYSTDIPRANIHSRHRFILLCETWRFMGSEEQASNYRKPRDKLGTRGRIEWPINRRLVDRIERHNSIPVTLRIVSAYLHC